MPKPLPPDFLAARKDVLMVVVRRVFKGSKEPLPDFPAWPGIYTPRPGPKPGARPAAEPPQAVPRRPPRPRNPQARGNCRYSVALGTIKPGSTVTWTGKTGEVLAYVAGNASPLPYIPEGTPRTRIMAAIIPCRAPRYLVRVTEKSGLYRYFMPRAVALERDNPALCRKVA